MDETEKQLKRVEKILEMVSEEYVKPEELENVFNAVIKVINDIKDNFEQKIVENKGEIGAELETYLQKVISLEDKIKSVSKEVKNKFDTDLKSVAKQLSEEVNRVESLIPEVPDLTPIEQKLKAIEKSIPKGYDDKGVLKKIDDLEDKLEEVKKRPTKETIVREMVRGGGNVEVYSGNNKIGSSQRIKFTGATVTNDADGAVKVAITGTGGGHTIQDEGTPLTQRTNLNFIGASVTVTDDLANDATKVTITGGGTGITRTSSVITASLTAGNTALTDYVYIANTGLSVTLPTAVSNTNLYTIKNSSVSSILVSTTGGQTIDGSSEIIMPIKDEALGFISDNSNWVVV